MATSLRNLKFGYAAGALLEPNEFVVYNTNTTTVNNGGCCCLWTVPAGASYAIFEMWSAGGNGGGGCCCMQGGGAGSGGYAIKACTVTPGQTIQICAAGSGCCVQTESGSVGCPTWVCATSGTTWLQCITGGYTSARSVTCGIFTGCYSCCSMCSCCGGRSNNADFAIAGITGTSINSQFCVEAGHQYAGQAYPTSGPRIGPNGCCNWYGSDCTRGMFPGGGALSVQLHDGSCYCGGFGGGGAVYVVYY